MTFAYPVFLLLAVFLLPLAAWGVMRQERRRRAALDNFGEREVLSRSSALPNTRRRTLGHALRLGALALALVALARPQFGKRPASLARTGRDVLVLLDLSRSMTATDVLPSRLEAAKRAVTEVIAASPGDRVGLVVFGGSAFLQLPLTADHSTVQTFLAAATPDDLGDPATDLSAALETAATTFAHEGDRGYQAVLLVSDGESGEGELKPPLTKLKRAGIPVFVIGVGTPEGGPIPADSADAPERYHRDHIGRVVVSRLDEDDLKHIAQETEGSYARWNPAKGTPELAAELAKLDTRTLSTRPVKQRADQFQWPLGLAVAALAFEPLVRAGGKRRRS